MAPIFGCEHLKLHREQSSDGKIGYGLDNLDDMVSAIKAAGFDAAQRDTVYNIVRQY